MVKNPRKNPTPTTSRTTNAASARGLPVNIARSRHATRTNSAPGCTIIQTMVAYPTTKLESQSDQIRSPALQCAHHATARPIANATASGHVEIQLSVLVSVRITASVRRVTLSTRALTGRNNGSTIVYYKQ